MNTRLSVACPVLCYNILQAESQDLMSINKLYVKSYMIRCEFVKFEVEDELRTHLRPAHQGSRKLRDAIPS